MTRVKRLAGGVVAAILIAPWIGGFVADAATSPPPPSGDDRATSVNGNATTCADVGFPNDSQFGAPDSSGKTGSGFTVTSDGQNLTVSAVPADTTIDVLIVKGGDAYNVYPSSTFASLPASGLHAPLVGKGNVGTISHWFLCYGPSDNEPEVTPATATSTGDCDSADLTLTAGSDDTTFTVTRAGDGAGQTYPVSAGQSTGVHVVLDAVHPSVTASGGGATTTFTRDGRICDDNGGGDNGGDGDGGGDNGGTGGTGGTGGNGAGGSSGGAAITNPATSVSKSCSSGITVTLSNLGATAPVTFTLTAPDGTTSRVTVGANTTTSRSFAVDEDTTGIVTVAAPGLAKRTFSYDKDCVTVLGVKHTRHHHARQPATNGDRVQTGARSAAALPFTGFNGLRTACDAALLIGIGLAFCLIGARRRTAPVQRRR